MSPIEQKQERQEIVEVDWQCFKIIVDINDGEHRWSYKFKYITYANPKECTLIVAWKHAEAGKTKSWQGAWTEVWSSSTKKIRKGDLPRLKEAEKLADMVGSQTLRSIAKGETTTLAIMQLAAEAQAKQCEEDFKWGRANFGNDFDDNERLAMLGNRWMDSLDKVGKIQSLNFCDNEMRRVAMRKLATTLKE